RTSHITFMMRRKRATRPRGQHLYRVYCALVKPLIEPEGGDCDSKCRNELSGRSENGREQVSRTRPKRVYDCRTGRGGVRSWEEVEMSAEDKSRGIFSALLAVMLLALLAVLAGGAARRESVTVDEVSHIGAGVSYLQRLDLRMNPEHPPLPKVLAAIPL